MTVLLKITKLKNYRFFSNFKWENDCRLFNKQFNLIYGWNGSGKTTLCDFFKDIEKRKPFSSDVNVELLVSDDFQDESPRRTINLKSITELTKHLKIFDQKYISENISGLNSISHIVAVGKQQIHLLSKLDVWQKRKEIISKYEKNHKTLIDSNNKDINNEKTVIAKNVREYLGYQQSSYNKNHVDKDLQNLTNSCFLTEDEIHNKLEVISGEVRDHIDNIIIDNFDKLSANNIANVLSESPLGFIIDELAKKTDVNKWVTDGLTLHEKHKTQTCLFCNNNIDPIRYKSLEQHFDNSYKDIIQKIENEIRYITNLLTSLNLSKLNMPISFKLYSEFRRDYEICSKNINELINRNTIILNDIIKILEDKKLNIINKELKEKFNESYAKYEDVNNELLLLNKIINNNNNKTINYIDEIKKAKDIIKEYLISVGKLKLDELNSHSKILKRKTEKIDTVLSKIDKKIKKIEYEVKNTKLPAEKINQDIELIFGRQEITFIDKNDGYQILRNGIKADNMSKGEQNAIALIYFFRSLEDYSNLNNDIIIMLDDPISSFDSNFYFNIMAYIREHSLKYKQLFLFTHKFSVTRDCIKIFDKKKSNRYFLKRSNNHPVLINEHKLLSEQYWDEYVYLFSLVYDFVKNPPKDYKEYLVYPNIGRRLLEAFLAFKIPGNDDLYKKVEKLSDIPSFQATAVLRLAHGKSHLRTIGDTDGTDLMENYEDLPSLFVNLLKYIEEHDLKHYNQLRELCGYLDAGKPAADIPLILPIARKIRLFTEFPVAAGVGDYLHDGDIGYEEIEVKNAKCDFALKVSGNSMEPDIPNGSIVMIHRSKDITPGKVGVFILNREAYIKKLIKKDGQFFLYSINEKYPLISIDQDSDFLPIGEFVGLLPSISDEK